MILIYKETTLHFSPKVFDQWQYSEAWDRLFVFNVTFSNVRVYRDHQTSWGNKSLDSDNELTCESLGRDWVSVNR